MFQVKQFLRQLRRKTFVPTIHGHKLLIELSGTTRTGTSKLISVKNGKEILVSIYPKTFNVVPSAIETSIPKSSRLSKGGLQGKDIYND